MSSCNSLSPASQRALTGTHEEIIRQLEGTTFEGGANNIPALSRAWDIAAENPNSAIVWICSPQPLLLTPLEELRQRIERRPSSHHGTLLYIAQAGNGPNRVIENLDGFRGFEVIPRMGSVGRNLESLFARLTGRARPLELVRTSERAAQTANTATARETSAHLARLWANDEVERLITDQGQGRREDAVQMAARYQLVTPVSGAVVLETQEQYRQAGLQPVAAGTVPTIPEPETVLLIAVVVVIMMWMLYRHKLPSV